MTPYQQSIEAAKSWKEAVEKMWQTQRSILKVSLIGLGLMIIAFALLFTGMMISSIDDLATLCLIFFFLFVVASCVFYIIAYVKQWTFFFDLKRWKNASPAALVGNIRILSICTLVTLIGAAASGVISGFTSIPYIGIIASVFSCIISTLLLAADIVTIVMFVKLKNAAEAPAKVQEGAKSIFLSYIVNYATAIIAGMFLGVALTTVIFNAIDNDYDYYNESYAYYDYDDDFDDALEDVFLSGMMEENLEDAYDDLTDSTLAAIAFIIAFITLFCGAIARLVLYYRGWWLISKSELPVLPEPIEEEVGEEVAYEEVESVETVENEQ